MPRAANALSDRPLVSSGHSRKGPSPETKEKMREAQAKQNEARSKPVLTFGKYQIHWLDETNYTIKLAGDPEVLRYFPTLDWACRDLLRLSASDKAKLLVKVKHEEQARAIIAAIKEAEASITKAARAIANRTPDMFGGKL